MPGITDWKSNPLRVIQSILDQSSKSDFNHRVDQFFEQTLSDKQEALKWIPSLNCCQLHTVQPDSVVQYRCMVQDMFGPEYFHDTYEVKNGQTNTTRLLSGRYRDIMSFENGEEIVEESSNSVMGERQVFYCVPVPGETAWCKQGYDSALTSSLVRRHEDAESGDGAASSKRRMDEDDEMVNDAANPTAETGGQTGEDVKMSEATAKRSRLVEGQSSDSGVTADESHTGGSNVDSHFDKPQAIVKVYGSLADSIKLNDVIHVVGVLSVDPNLASLSSSEDEDMLCKDEVQAHNPPASLVPRIHAISVTPVSVNNPLVSPQNCALTKAETLEIRENLVSCLSHSLCGDGLAAEFLLSHLISHVYMRRDGLAVGKYSLNLTKVPPTIQEDTPTSTSQSFTQLLYSLIQRFVSMVSYLPLSLDTMNNETFIPSKDYDANRLRSGVLQLPPRYHLILDETRLQPGQLNEKGVLNLTSLGNLIKWQKVSYDFKFHAQEFNTDVSVLALSEGRSLLPSDVQVPLELDTSIPLAQRYESFNSFLSPELEHKIRLYLGTVPETAYKMSEEASKSVQNEFVSSRQADKNSMSVEDFESLLVLSRLQAISRGESDLSNETWQRTLELESARKARLASTTNSST